jgi:peroxiredoxin Q/BCP
MPAKELKVGQKAPSYGGAVVPGTKVANKEFAGKNVVLFFYPKDSTSG